jgi:hypothetical protein
MDFQLLGHTSLWAMRPIVGLPPRARDAYMLQVVGRMKPGVSIKAAEADLGAVAASLAGEFPQTNKGRGVALERMHDSIIGSDLRLTNRSGRRSAEYLGPFKSRIIQTGPPSRIIQTGPQSRIIQTGETGETGDFTYRSGLTNLLIPFFNSVTLKLIKSPTGHWVSFRYEITCAW